MNYTFTIGTCYETDRHTVTVRQNCRIICRLILILISVNTCPCKYMYTCILFRVQRSSKIKAGSRLKIHKIKAAVVLDISAN